MRGALNRQPACCAGGVAGRGVMEGGVEEEMEGEGEQLGTIVLLWDRRANCFYQFARVTAPTDFLTRLARQVFDLASPGLQFL